MPASPLRATVYENHCFHGVSDDRASLKLEARHVEKPWGRRDLPNIADSAAGSKIGEIWFEHPAADDLPLLVKKIFTSEKLSVQVHPDDEQARLRGLRRGKSECWYVLNAEPGATVGLGLRSQLTATELRAAAVNGFIEHLLDWRPVSAGDFFYVPAGTIHALGAGITVIELQQNADATYRLYDYGRPRELHLNDGIAVSRVGGYAEHWSRPAAGPTGTILHNGPHFCLVRATSADGLWRTLSNRRRWVMPLEGRIWSEGETASEGECLLLQPGAQLSLSHSAVVLIGAEGPN